MSAVYVYRLYDEQGTLLYVGQSRDPFARFRQHMYENTWWAERVMRGSIRVYRSRGAAVLAERDTIIREKPVYNRQHFGRSTRSGWTRQDYIAQTRARLEYAFGHGPGSDSALKSMRIEYRERYGRSLGDDVGYVTQGSARSNPASSQRRRRIA